MRKIIEFFGLPGAGKSTVCSGWLERGGSARFDVFSRGDLFLWWKKIGLFTKLKVFFSFSLRAPTIAKLIFTLDKKSISSGKKIIWIFWFSSKLDHYISTTDGDLYVFDQLYLQDVWSILVDNPAEKGEWVHKILEALLVRMPIYYEAFYFSVEPSIAASRVYSRTRGTSRFDAMQLDEIRSSFHRHASLFDLIKSNCPSGIFIHNASSLSSVGDDGEDLTGFEVLLGEEKRENE
ncbi:hypothetical protein EQ836_23280 [Ectopseudomonas mendocina]|uniref:Uncharacterized protein n=1 Tax=Ectopseudomonas mendocina TaxID=300 RepID=A0ABD7RPX1_ECTME|nr:hypothetical protein [Pseudomonas mendocina]TRO10079.1 hypothetical protein EQ829_23080 [Pseudomonas mendocina]TRO12147.1 hypothetical protein EQ836_23280 [Pseudomonas mendocina]